MPREPDSRYSHKGIYSAWLTKAKGDGAKAKWFQSSCRRFFTIDFDSQIVFYAHSETDRKISLPIQFRDILSAAMVSDEDRWGHAGGRALPLNSRGRPLPVGEVPFILQTRERRIRLAADTESAAFSWVDMLNTARRIGQNEEPQGEELPGPVKTSAFDLESELMYAKRSRSNGGKDSPTTFTSSKASHTTNEGSDGNSVSSPTAWSDNETSEARLTPVSSMHATQTATTDEARVSESFVASECMDNHPATSSTSVVPSSTRKVLEPASGQLRPMLQASDFGFDEEGDESEREPSALSRDSSLDCITISPKPRPGLQSEESSSLAGTPHVEQTIAESAVEACNCEPRRQDDDDDSDCDDRCLLQVRDRRIELDLELIKRHQRPRNSQSGHDRERQQRRNCDSSATVDERGRKEAEREDEDQARIAADLELLRNHGGAHSVANAAAPLRKRIPTESEDKVEEKARRKAEKRVAKEAAKLATTAEDSKEPEEDKERIAADLALVERRRQKHERKIMKAAREAGHGIEGLKEASVPA